MAGARSHDFVKISFLSRFVISSPFGDRVAFLFLLRNRGFDLDRNANYAVAGAETISKLTGRNLYLHI